MKYGYARVSTVQQDTAMQMEAFRRAEVAEVWEEKKSGKRGSKRPVLEAVLAMLKPGDVLVVYKVDRLARSLADLLAILERVAQAGASFKSLTEPIDTSDAMGEFLLQILGAVAQLNRSMILQSTAAGRAEAVKRGVRFGSPISIQRDEVMALRAKGMLWREVAQCLGRSRCQVMRAASGVRVGDGGRGVGRRGVS
jgi:DNA invertase Pin-like site-specific DNA recombinase